MNEQSAGQEDPTPDFIPGWFKRRDGAPAEYTEAVRLVGENEGFPLHFLRSGESVSPAKPPQRGVTITFEEQPQFGLAVPPGYWIVRESSTGKLRLGPHDEFRATWTRAEDRNWIPAVERAEPRLKEMLQPVDVEATVVESSDPSQVGRTGRVPVEALVSGGDRPAWAGEPPAEGTRRKLILDTISKFSLCVELTASESKCLTLADAIEAALLRVVDNGATPESGSPASVAMDTLDGLGVPRTREGAILTISDRVTVAADELVEARRQISNEAMARGTDALAEVNVHTLLDGAGIRRIDDEGETDARILTLRERIEVLLRQFEARQATIDGLADTVNAQSDLLGDRDRQARRDRIMEALTAHDYRLREGHGGKLTSANAVDLANEIERAFGVLRDNPHLPLDLANEARMGLVELEVEKALNHLTLARREWRGTGPHSDVEYGKSLRRAVVAVRRIADPDFAPEVDVMADDDPAATIKFLEGEVERQLGGREEARSSEARFSEERDCAFALLRWLLPVTVAKRID